MTAVPQSAPMAYLMYLAIDVSESMGRGNAPTPSKMASEGLRSIVKSALVTDASVGQKGKLGILAYNHRVEVRRSATEDAPLVDPGLPDPGGQTDFKVLFDELLTIVSTDMAYAHDKGWNAKVPSVYILTDGQPYLGQAEQRPDEYLPAVQRFHSHHFRRHTESDGSGEGFVKPIVVPFGFGNVNEATLCRLVSPGMPAYIAANSSQPGLAVKSIVNAIISSMVQTTTKGEFTPVIPPGTRLVNCQ